MCMDKIGKIQCRKFWSSARIPVSYKKNTIEPLFIFLGVRNYTGHIMTSIIRIRNNTTNKKRNVDGSNLAPHGDLYLQPGKIIDRIPDSVEGKGIWRLHMWFGIDTHTGVINFPTWNVSLCMLYCHLFHSNLDIVNIDDSISTIYKRLKSQKIAKICTFLWYVFLSNSYITILVTIGSIRVVVRTGTGGDAPQMLVQGGKHGRGATGYTGTK